MNDNGITLLGISGSSRLKATHFAVNEALRYAHERYGVTVDYFSAHRKTIGFCVHCDACVRKKQGCAFKDDMEDLYPRLVRADAWILGTPVYQGQISAQLKAMMDRSRAVVAGDPQAFRGKVGAGIAVGGDRSGGQEPTLLCDRRVLSHQRDDPRGRRRVRRQPRRGRLVPRQGRRWRPGR